MIPINKIRKLYLATILLLWLAGSALVSAQHPVTLEQAIDAALQRNPGIKAGESQIKEAQAKHVQAFSSYLPQADVQMKYFYTNNLPGMYPLAGTSVPVLNGGVPTGENIIMHPMAPYPNLDRDAMTTDVNIIYPLYAGNKRKNAVESTLDLQNAYVQDLNETKAQTVLNVKTIFYNILFIDRLIRVNQEALVQLNEHLSMAEKALKEGMRSEFDVLSFKNKIEEFKSKIIEIEENKKVAELALKNLMVLPDSTEITCVGSISADSILFQLKVLSSTESMIHSSYRMQYMNFMKQALDKKAKIEAAENAPVLFAYGNYHIYHGIDFPPFDASWRQGYVIGLGLKINLFDGNLSKGKVAEIKANIDKINSYQDGYSLKLTYEKQKSLSNIESLHAQKISAISNLVVAKKAYEIAKIAYENGVITNIELNDAQLNVIKAETLILNIDKNMLLEMANLEYLEGSLK
ncbi:MAG: TolC family protein [Candidatus Ratteibacteria bacterium]